MIDGMHSFFNYIVINKLKKNEKKSKYFLSPEQNNKPLLII